MRKRTILALFALYFFITSYAQTYDVYGIRYRVESTTERIVSVTSGGNYNGEVIIPSTVIIYNNEYSVTGIGDAAFEDCTGLKSITIPNSITSIGASAFYGCSGLKTITIPNSVTSIGDNAFYGCKNVSAIYWNSNVSPKSITQYCKSKLVQFELGDRVTSIRYDVFTGCTVLTSIIVSPDNIIYDSRNDCNAIIETSTNTLLVGCQNTTIPNSVTSIFEFAFYRCTGLRKIDIPNSVTSIGHDAFYGCTGLTSISIPNNVTSISSNTFDGCSGLKTITIPNSVTSIGYNAFSGCASLTSLTIPNSVTRISGYAFYGCTGLTSITIPNSVISIGDDAFYGCTRLTSITIPNSVTSIGLSAFYNTAWYNNQPDGIVCIANILYKYKGEMSSNTSIIIPDDVTIIGDGAFSGCTGLTSITMPNSVTSIGGLAFDRCQNVNAIYWNSSVSPECITRHCKDKLVQFEFGDCVTNISGYPFSGCTALTSLTIPNSVTSISGYAFYGCNNVSTIYWNSNVSPKCITQYCRDKLVQFEFGDCVTNIGQDAFYSCTALTSLTIPDSVTSIDNYAFQNCTSLTSITIPNSVTSIGNGVFSGCSGLTSITIPNSMTSIGDGAFSGCSGLNTITIPNSVTNIENYAFQNCTGLTSISIPNKVTSIGDDAFRGCNNVSVICWNSNVSPKCITQYCKDKLVQFEFGDDVTSIGQEAFYGCTVLTSITLPNRVTSIEDKAFSNCTGLITITLPNSVISIENYAFQNCTGLTSISIPNNVTSISSNAFDGCNNISVIYWSSSVSPECVTKYCKDKLVQFEFGDCVTSIGNYAFRNCTALTSLTIPNSVTSIGYSAFSGCASFTSLIIPNSVTSISGYAFDGCTGLTSITIPNSVTSIGDDAFRGCNNISVICWNSNLSPKCITQYCRDKLVQFEFGDDVTSIGQDAISCCTGLTSITIPNNVTSIGSGAFAYCRSLTSIFIPNSVISIGDYAFRNCTGLISIKVSPDNIVYDSRNDCNAIIETGTNTLLVGCQKTTIPNSVTSIGYGAYAGCSGLTSITIPNSVTSIGDYAFYDFTDLTSITIPNSVTSIGDYAFSFTSLTSISIPNSVTSIGDHAFSGTSLTSITIPNSVTSIGDYAFYHCNYLLSINIPANVKKIGTNLFSGCDSLEIITVDTNNTVYDSRGNCNAIIETATNTLIVGCKNTAIPNGVTSIGDYAFSECRYLSSINIPESVISIGADAFRWCKNLSTIKFPSKLKTIGIEAFGDCTSLTTVAIPESVTSIGNGAFEFCTSLVSVSLPKNITIIGSYLFSTCYSLSSIVIPSGVTSIGEYAFRGCRQLTSVNIPEGVTSIGDGAFGWCDSLLSISFPSTLSDIGQGAIENCDKLESIYFKSKRPEEVFINKIFGYSRINDCKFYVPGGYLARYKSIFEKMINGSYNNLEAIINNFIISDSIECGTNVGGIWYDITSAEDRTATVVYGKYEDEIKIPKTVIIDGAEYIVTEIGDEAFYNRKGVSSITIPESVTHIGANTFYGCDMLSTMTVCSRYPDQIQVEWLNVDFDHCILYVPGGCRYQYSLTGPWFNFKNIRITHEVDCGINVSGICYEITSHENKTVSVVHGKYKGSVVIPYTVVIEGVTYSVTGISQDAFSNCSELVSIRIPQSIEKVGHGTFDNCTSLKNVIFDGNTEIGSHAFIGCQNIKSVTCSSPTPGNMVVNKSYAVGEHYEIKNSNSSYFSVTRIYNEELDRTVSEINNPSINSWKYNIITTDIPVGTYRVSVGILPSPDSLPNYIHPSIKGITENDEVVLLDSIRIDTIIDSRGRKRVVNRTIYYVNDISAYDVINIADTLFVPDGFKGLRITLSSGVNESNADNYSSTLLLDRIFFEPLDKDVTAESFAGPFTESVFNNAMLYVPEDAIYAYREAEGWKLFKNIAIGTSVEPIRQESKKDKGSLNNAVIYDMTGRRVKETSLDLLAPGVYLIDGKKYLKR